MKVVNGVKKRSIEKMKRPYSRRRCEVFVLAKERIVGWNRLFGIAMTGWKDPGVGGSGWGNTAVHPLKDRII